MRKADGLLCYSLPSRQVSISKSQALFLLGKPDVVSQKH